MEPILDERNRPVLAHLARSRGLLAFDFDGTLAPIVADRDAAVLQPATAALLAEVAQRFPCAIISGRARDDVRARLAGAPIAHVIGNHGIEPSPSMRTCELDMRALLEPLQQIAGRMPGVHVEDKRFSLAVHFRAAPDREAAARAIREALEGMSPRKRVVDGDCVFNVVPVGAPNKGDALLRLLDETGASRALFVGDDVTDEDVFALADPRVVGVRVGPSPTSHAPWFLRAQREMDDLLGVLVALGERERPSGPPTDRTPAETGSAEKAEGPSE